MFLCLQSFGQGKISGIIKSDNEALEFVSVGIIENSIFSLTDSKGKFKLDKVPFGTHQIKISHVAFKDTTITVSVSKSNPNLNLSINLTPTINELNDFQKLLGLSVDWMQ